MVGISIYFSLRKINYAVRDNHDLMELFAGLRIWKRAQFYTSYFLIRRTIYVLTVLYFKKYLPIWHTVFIIVFFQLTNLVYLYKVNPFFKMQDNVVEIINENFYTFFISLQFYFNKREDWTNSKTNIFLYVLTSNNIVIAMALICKGFDSLSLFNLTNTINIL